MANELKQAVNMVEIEGILLEKDFEVIEVDLDSKDKSKGKCKAIRGSVKIETDAHSQHKVSAYSKSKKNDGNDNSNFTGLVTVNTEYKSVADLLKTKNPDTNELYTKEEAYANADRLTITSGEITLNEYATVTGDWKSYQEIKSNFLGRTKDLSTYSPKATFKIQGVMRGMKDEIDKKTQAPTGRKKIGLIVPIFGGQVIPLDFTVDGQNGAYMESAFPKGSTVEVWGSIVNNVIVEEKVTQGFGKANTETIKTYVNEFLIEGGQPQPLSGDKAFDSELIQKAMAERELYIERTKVTKKEKGNKPAEKKAPANFDY